VYPTLQKNERIAAPGVSQIRLPALHVKLKGHPDIIKIPAAKIEDEQTTLCAKGTNGEILARFNSKEVAGWWVVEQEDVSLTGKLEEARERIQKHREKETARKEFTAIEIGELTNN